MYRLAFDDLKLWASDRKPKPLLIRGARQVGKSTLVRMFAEREGYDLVEVNLEKHKLGEVENQKSFSVSRLLSEIEIVAGKKIHSKTLLFLDEIQSQPLAIGRLRYLYEDTEGLRTIAAGSLLDVVLDQEHFSMPVGRIQFYTLGPFTFKEYLEAIGEAVLLRQLAELAAHNPPSLALHERALERFREFLFIGGMPEAIKVFVQTRSMEKVREVHHSLLDTYRSDIPKYASGKSGLRVQDAFLYALKHCGQVKVKFSHVSSSNSEQIKKALDLLARAHVIRKVIHSHGAGVPLEAGENPSVLKLFFLDVGLLNAFQGVSWEYLFRSEPDLFLLHGLNAEQFVAQHLAGLVTGWGGDLHYWLREGKADAAEVDFLWSRNRTIIPIEVKSGKGGKLNSLWQYVELREPQIAIRFDLELRDQFLSELSRKSNTGSALRVRLLSIPLYAVEEIQRILDLTLGSIGPKL